MYVNVERIILVFKFEEAYSKNIVSKTNAGLNSKMKEYGHSFVWRAKTCGQLKELGRLATSTLCWKVSRSFSGNGNPCSSYNPTVNGTKRLNFLL